MLTTLVALFVALQVADVVLTVAILRRGGRELNPVARRFMAALGIVGGALALKAVVAAVVALCLLELSRTWQLGLLGLFNVVYVGIVFHNARVLRRRNKRR